MIDTRTLKFFFGGFFIFIRLSIRSVSAACFVPTLLCIPYSRRAESQPRRKLEKEKEKVVRKREGRREDFFGWAMALQKSLEKV